jgi:hypothetical protein
MGTIGRECRSIVSSDNRCQRWSHEEVCVILLNQSLLANLVGIMRSIRCPSTWACFLDSYMTQQQLCTRNFFTTTPLLFMRLICRWMSFYLERALRERYISRSWKLCPFQSINQIGVFCSSSSLSASTIWNRRVFSRKNQGTLIIFWNWNRLINLKLMLNCRWFC